MLPYSRSGSIKVVYIFLSDLRSNKNLCRLNDPIRLVTFSTIALIWLVQVKSLDSVKPSYIFERLNMENVSTNPCSVVLLSFRLIPQSKNKEKEIAR